MDTSELFFDKDRFMHNAMSMCLIRHVENLLGDATLLKICFTCREGVNIHPLVGDATSSSVTYTIQGISVVFPCKAYPSQISMMEKILQGLKRGQNCLLESPTGSGKTLALLCACLAWQRNEYIASNGSCQQRRVRGRVLTRATGGRMSYLRSASPHWSIGVSSQAPSTPTPTLSSSANGEASAGPGWKLSAARNRQRSQWQPVSLDGGNLGGNLQERVYLESKNGICDSDANRSDAVDDESGFDADDDFKPVKRSSKPSSPPARENPGSPTFGKSCRDGINAFDGECEAKAKGAEAGIGAASRRRPARIFFGTRTHKQITQVIREFGKTIYKDTTMCILGSRNHMCIHPEVSQSQNRNEACKDLLDGSGCKYHANVPSKVRFHDQLEQYGVPEPWDIEDIVQVGKKIRVCPYYATRGLMPKSDIVFCPYNYLIDPLIRDSMEINVKNSLIILDEAHNMEDSARSAVSFNLDLNDLLATMNDLERIASFGFEPKLRIDLAEKLSQLGNWIDTQSKHVNQYQSFTEASKVWTGLEFIGVLNNLGWGPGDYPGILKMFETIRSSEEEQKKKSEKQPKMSSVSYHLLTGLLMILGYLYKSELKYMHDFRMVITKTLKRSDNRFTRSHARKQRTSEKVTTVILNFWCLNPAVAFSDFHNVVHSIILTSGTLSPLDSFESELDFHFKIKLEANHVIHSSQVWVGVIGQSLNGTSLNANFRNSDTYAFQDEVGEVVLKICETISHGVLCFLPSYNLLEKLVHRWQVTSLWNKLSASKLVISEPRGSDKELFDDVLKRFYEANENFVTNLPEGPTGALLLAVCRGKVSEGLDFADNNARAVITIGIPFPNVKDIQVDLKKKYNNESCRTRNLLTGDRWYEIQAFRALNQALGRCIRHRNDWGALILIDGRFMQNKQYTNGLSKWVRKSLQYYQTSQDAMQSLALFMSRKQDDLQNISTNENSTRLSKVELNESATTQDLIQTKLELNELTSSPSNAANGINFQQRFLNKLRSKVEAVPSNEQVDNSEIGVRTESIEKEADVPNPLDRTLGNDIGIVATLEKPLAASTPLRTFFKTLATAGDNKGTGAWHFKQRIKPMFVHSVHLTGNQEVINNDQTSSIINEEGAIDKSVEESTVNQGLDRINDEATLIPMPCSPEEICTELKNEQTSFKDDIDNINFVNNDSSETADSPSMLDNINMIKIDGDIYQPIDSPILFDSDVSWDGDVAKNVDKNEQAPILNGLNERESEAMSNEMEIDHDCREEETQLCIPNDAEFDDNLDYSFSLNIKRSKSTHVQKRTKFPSSFDEAGVRNKRKSRLLRRRRSTQLPQLTLQSTSQRDLLDDISSEVVNNEPCQPIGICIHCRNELLSTLDGLRAVFDCPKSVIKFSRANRKILCNCSTQSQLMSSLTTMQTPVTLEVKTNDALWNAIWSEEDGCCFQMLVCKECKTNAALIVRAASDKSTFIPNQVWFLLNSVWICPKYLSCDE